MWAEIKAQNVAAGVSVALESTSLTYIISGAIYINDSVFICFIFAAVGLAVLRLSALLGDKLLLPAHPLEDEILKDKNWGDDRSASQTYADRAL